MCRGHEGTCWRTAAIEAVEEVRAAVLSESGSESVGPDETSGRVLTDSITASRTLPEFDRATMDGYALDATDDYPLTVAHDEVYPEDDPPSIGEGEAVEIATGASLPPEANAVLKREESTVDGDRLTGPTLEPGTYTYERGSSVERGSEGFEYAVPLTLDADEAMPLGHVDSALQVYDGTFDPSVRSSSTRATRADGFVLTRSALDSGEAVGVVPRSIAE